MTARDIISAALRKLGAVASGESMSANEAADGLTALNGMISSWSTESLLINSVVREVFPLVVGQASYTMGTGGNFNTQRPLRIETALVQLAATTPVTEISIRLLDVDQYSAIGVKTLQSTYPTDLYAEGTNPLETLNVFPVPSASCNLVLYSWKELTQFADLSTAATFPAGYEEALIYNLAVRLAPEYGRTCPMEVAGIASDSKATIKRMNHKPAYLTVERALMSESKSFNIYTGEFK